MGKKAEQPKPTLKKGDRFTAYDEKARSVRGVVLDVLPWSKWPLKCDVTVDGIRQITKYNADELGAVIITDQGGSQ